MKKGSHQSEEAKQKLRIARANQKPMLIGRYGITEQAYNAAIANGLRWCRDCKGFLPPSCFYGEDKRCIECTKARVQSWRDRRTYQQKDGDNKYTQHWRRANDPHVRQKWLAKYGVDENWFEAAMAEQNNGCGICGAPAKPPRKYLCLDHCHKTGKARGLLCVRCNAFVSGIDDGLLAGAIAYLGKFGGVIT